MNAEYGGTDPAIMYKRIKEKISYRDLSTDIKIYYDKQIDNSDDAQPFYTKSSYIKKRSQSNKLFPNDILIK